MKFFNKVYSTIKKIITIIILILIIIIIIIIIIITITIIILFYFILFYPQQHFTALSLHFTPGLQPAVCFLH